MNKALKDISEQLKKVDVVTYLLDARIPISSLNPSLSSLVENKPILYVINKIDMADEKRIKELLPQFRTANSDYIVFNSTLSGKSEILIDKLKKLAEKKIERYRAKGVKPTIRTMVVGIPNCGKSTLVNNLSKKAKAVTGNKAGVTKHGLWLPLGDGIEIYDTPGTLYPNISDQEVAKKLAYVGSVRDEILDFYELSVELLNLLQKLYPREVEARYKGAKTIEDIAISRKYVLSGGEVDVERAARMVVDDFRKTRIGKLTLDWLLCMIKMWEKKKTKLLAVEEKLSLLNFWEIKILKFWKQIFLANWARLI